MRSNKAEDNNEHSSKEVMIRQFYYIIVWSVVNIFDSLTADAPSNFLKEESSYSMY